MREIVHQRGYLRGGTCLKIGARSHSQPGFTRFRYCSCRFCGRHQKRKSGCCHRSLRRATLNESRARRVSSIFHRHRRRFIITRALLHPSYFDLIFKPAWLSRQLGSPIASTVLSVLSDFQRSNFFHRCSILWRGIRSSTISSQFVL